MDDNKAIEVLTKMLEKDAFSLEEKEALTTALGVLMLTVKTSESYLKQLKVKRDRKLGLGNGDSHD